jgi:hypothetical protein
VLDLASYRSFETVGSSPVAIRPNYLAEKHRNLEGPGAAQGHSPLFAIDSI